MRKVWALMLCAMLAIAPVAQAGELALCDCPDGAPCGDTAAQVDSIARALAACEADILLWYSFPRHQAMEAHAALREGVAASGVEIVDVAAPDSTGAGGPEATRQFIRDEIPVAMGRYEGQRVAVFGTDACMQAPLREAIEAWEGAALLLPCPAWLEASDIVEAVCANEACACGP